MVLNSAVKSLDLSRQARIMGILNVTPDSFSDGGRHPSPEAAVQHALAMVREGACLIDIGGESTRPGARPVAADEETKRILPVLRSLRALWDGWISIDTTKAEVAHEALRAGADMINDISGLTADPAMPSVCAQAGCAVVVMHRQGTPETMQLNPRYEDVAAEVRAFFVDRLHTLAAAGIPPERICFDPGIGFGKSHEHNLALLRSLGSLAPAGKPLLLGASRKSFIARITGSADPAKRLWPTVAVTTAARLQGVMLHRVHDVRENLDALRVTEAVNAAT
jgi:dihydropteroate synthase